MVVFPNPVRESYEGAIAIRGLVENSTQQAAGRIQGTADIANAPGAETGAVTRSAAAAEKLKLKTAIGAVIAVIAGELDRITHSRLLCFYYTQNVD